MASVFDRIAAANAPNTLLQAWRTGTGAIPGSYYGSVYGPRPSDITFGGANDPLAQQPSMGNGAPATPATPGMMGSGMQPGAMSGLAGMMATQMQQGAPTQIGTAWRWPGYPADPHAPNTVPSTPVPEAPKPEPGTDRNYADPRLQQPLQFHGGGSPADDDSHGTSLIASMLAKNPAGTPAPGPAPSPTPTPTPHPRPGHGGGGRPWWRR